MGEGHSDAKEYTLPGDRKEFTATPRLVPRLLGAEPGDTVSYYLEAFDNRDGRPNSARTPIYSFTVASASSSLPREDRVASDAREVRPGEDLPGRPQPAFGGPDTSTPSPSPSFGPSREEAEKEFADARSRLLDMIKRDREALDTIARHMERSDSASPADRARTDRAAVTETPSDTVTTAQQREQPPGESKDSPEGAVSQVTEGSGEKKEAASAQSRAAGEPSTAKAAQVDGSQAEESSLTAASADAERPSPPDARAGSQTGASSDASARDASDSAQPADAQSAQSGAEPGASEQSSQQSSASQQTSPASSGSPQAATEGAQATAQESAPDAASPSTPSPTGEGEAAQSEGQTGDAAEAGESDQSSRAEGPADSAAPGEGEAEGSADGADSSGQTGAPRSEASASASGEDGTSADRSPSQQSSPGSRASEGRDAGVGGATERTGEVEDFTAPPDLSSALAPRESPAQGEYERIGATRRLVGQLSYQIKSHGVDESLLKDLGWVPARLRTFVREYEGVIGKLDALPYEEQLELESRFGSTTVVTGERGASSVGAADTAGSPVARELADAAKDFVREDVSPRYREMVEEYYRSLAGEKKGKPE
jgi:hypothetical protein